MSNNDTFSLHDECIKIVKNASNYITRSNSGKILKETRRDVKVIADEQLDKYLKEKLYILKPYNILSEESGIQESREDGNSYKWIIDPLDGSVNYSRNIPLNCISVGLWNGEDPVFGVIYDFNRDEVFSGIIGEGAWLNGQPISVGTVKSKDNAILCTGFPVDTEYTQSSLLPFIENIKDYKKIRMLGTAALSLAYVSCGRADVYEEKDIKIWDVAAGIAVLEAAGGSASYKYRDREKHMLHVIATNKYLKRLI